MKRFLRSIAALLVVAVALVSCSKKFKEDYSNLNQPSTVPPSLLLSTIEYNMWDAPFNQDERNDQFTCINYTYYGNNGYWDGTNGNSQYASLNYTDLQNVINMQNGAAVVAGGAPYIALANFFKAWYFYQMTMKVGDLPMTQALQQLTNLQPKYDTQKQIFIQCLKWLDTANTQMGAMISSITGTPTFAGDIYYMGRPVNALSSQGAMVEWQKVVNTFRLRILIQLSKKSADADLNVAQQFANVLNNPARYPLMTSLDDNLQFEYINPYNIYPTSPSNFGNYSNRCNTAATYLNTVAGLNDLRAMLTAEPARGLDPVDTVNGKPVPHIPYSQFDTLFTSYVGAPSGQNLSDMEASCANAAATTVSLINRHRYWETYTGENTFIVSYPELCFNIAEAINHGWVTGDAEQWYINGIQASQRFYGIVDGANVVTLQIPSGQLGQDETYTVHWYWNNYYAQSTVKYAGNTAAGLNQILTQKYLAFFRNSGLEAYYQWRRTGVPAFDTGTGTGNSGIIPIRWQYPLSESSTNTANYNAAVQSQYGGQDNINGQMWLLK